MVARARYGLAVITLFLTFILWASRADAKPDSLDAHILHDDKAYSSLLYRKLVMTPADYGRIIVAPSFSGESVLSIYSSPANRRRYFVTITRAAENLYQAARAKDVCVERTDAELPAQTALSVQKAWLAMLKPPQRSEPTPSLDGQVVEFSIDLGGAQSLYGDLPDTRGPLTEALWQLGGLLTKYCETKADQRPTIASQIERHANALVAKLKRRVESTTSKRASYR